MYEKYMTVRFLLRRMELGLEEEAYRELTYAISTEAISCEAVIEMVIRSVVDRKTVLIQLMAVYEKAGLDTSYEKCKNLYQLVESKPNAVTFCKRE